MEWHLRTTRSTKSEQVYWTYSPRLSRSDLSGPPEPFSDWARASSSLIRRYSWSVSRIESVIDFKIRTNMLASLRGVSLE